MFRVTLDGGDAFHVIVANDESEIPELVAVRQASQGEPVYGVEKRHIDAERDRRMGTFAFGGKLYDLAGQSLANVSGAGTLALAALINGAQVGDLRWADPDADFTWIANDNALVPMDAQTTWAFAQTAAAWRKHCIFKARQIKDMTPIPSDYTADSYWI